MRLFADLELIRITKGREGGERKKKEGKEIRFSLFEYKLQPSLHMLNLKALKSAPFFLR
jgi:hypothetical protein